MISIPILVKMNKYAYYFLGIFFIYDINNWMHIINKLLLLEDVFKEPDKVTKIYFIY